MKERAILDPESLSAYRQRWQAVAAIEKAEQQATTPAERWQQLNALLRIAMALELPLVQEDSLLDEGRQRWQKLITHYLHSQDEYGLPPYNQNLGIPDEYNHEANETNLRD